MVATIDAEKDPFDAIVDAPFDSALEERYLVYAMSTITARSLPDLRDGLKPVHRRILWGMRQLRLAPDSAFKKSSRVVGDVMGKFHPHGNLALYDALVRLAQPFALRYPLVEGQGNFGNIDGDNAAAERYTECRLTKTAMQLMEGLDEGTVDFVPTYNNEEEEPSLFPGLFPNLLANGASGIAVGMATSIPSHNAAEVIDAALELIDNPHVEHSRLMELFKGPDFATGGLIVDSAAAISAAYEAGRGSFRVRARFHAGETKDEADREAGIERLGGGQYQLVVSEVPYGVPKGRLIEQIAQLIADRKLPILEDVRDESDEQIRIVFVPKSRNVDPELLKESLYKLTDLETRFGLNLNVLDATRTPMVMGLHELLSNWVAHQIDILQRRSRHRLQKIADRLELVEGYIIAFLNLDRVIEIIRYEDEPKAVMIAEFALTDVQAEAILNMRLAKLTGLEIDKLEAELTEVRATIADLRDILGSRTRREQIIKDELTTIAAAYGDDRRTELTNMVSMSLEDLLADEEMVITVSHGGYIKRLPLDTYRAQKRGGRGITGSGTKEEDWVEHLYTAQTHDYLMIFTARGHCYWLKVHEIPEASRASRGKPIVNLLALDSDERIAAIVPVREFRDDRFLLFASRKGVVKKTALSAYRHVRVKGVNAINITQDDELIDVQITGGNDEVILATYEGMAIRFHESDVREMGRVATGVRGIRLRNDDAVVGMVVIREDVRDTATLLIVTERGRGKRTAIDDYRFQSRGGMGVINFRINEQTGKIVAIKGVQPEDELMLISRHGIVTRQRVAEIRVIGRATQGVRVMALDEGDVLMDVARVVPEDDNGNGTHAAEVPIALDEGDPTDARAIVEDDAEGILGDDTAMLDDGISDVADLADSVDDGSATGDAGIDDDTSRFDEEDLSPSDSDDVDDDHVE